MSLSWVLILTLLAGILLTLRSAAGRKRGVWAAQALAAVFLYLCLFPPQSSFSWPDDTLIVLAPGVTTSQLSRLPRDVPTVALPGVATSASAPVMPDLATALRQHPSLTRLHVAGHGLPPRDQDSARTLPLQLDAAPLPNGVVALIPPASVTSGQRWILRGQVQGYSEGRVDLLDPGGQSQASQPLDEGGQFSLSAIAGPPGRSLFTLQVRSKAGEVVETLSVPVVAEPGVALRLLLWNGAPSPETKYLRRWATDAGLTVESRTAVSKGMSLIEGQPDTGTLDKHDMVILDERAWALLTPTQTQSLKTAVENGLGLLLRLTGTVLPEQVEAWREWGIPLRATEPPQQAVSLNKTWGLTSRTPALSLLPWQIDAKDAAPLLFADDGIPVGSYRFLGRGRVGVWPVTDSYRWALQGNASAFDTLWAKVLGTLARPQGESSPRRPSLIWVNQRTAFCGLATESHVMDAQQQRIPLQRTADHCAAFWPRQTGWHRLHSGTVEQDFWVDSPDDHPALFAAETQHATRSLQHDSPSPSQPTAHKQDWPRWPFFLLWLFCSALIWWQERCARHTAS